MSFFSPSLPFTQTVPLQPKRLMISVRNWSTLSRRRRLTQFTAFHYCCCCFWALNSVDTLGAETNDWHHGKVDNKKERVPSNCFFFYPPPPFFKNAFITFAFSGLIGKFKYWALGQKMDDFKGKIIKSFFQCRHVTKDATRPQLCGRCFHKPNKNIISPSSQAAEEMNEKQLRNIWNLNPLSFCPNYWLTRIVNDHFTQ